MYSNSTNLQEVLRFMSYRFYVGMTVLKQRNEESDGSISWKRNVQSEWERESRLGVRRSVLCFSNQMISFNAWIFRKRKGFYGLTDFLWIHADLIWEPAAQRTETEGWRIVSLFFLSKCSLPVDMFKFPILGQFLISKRNLEGFQLLSKSCCEQTHWFGRPTV